MKTNFKIVIMLLALCGQFAFAGDGAGNGDGDLAVRNILKSGDGLTPTEKIYKMWQESEKSLPDFGGVDKGIWLGIAIKQGKVVSMALVTNRVAPVMAGKLEIIPETITGYFAQSSFDRLDYMAGFLPVTDINLNDLSNSFLISIIDGKSINFRALVVDPTKLGPIELSYGNAFTSLDIRKYSSDILVGSNAYCDGDAKDYCSVVIFYKKKKEGK